MDNTQADSGTQQVPAIATATKHKKTIKSPRDHLRQFKKFWMAIPFKKRLLILVAIGVFLVAGTSAALRVFIKDPPPPAAVYIAPPPEPEPVPTTAPSPLTGVEVPLADSKLPVTGVMIENSPDARPQSGLRDGGVVFEAIAEGGITRFLSLYQEAKPDYIGPVRSVRPYYLDFLRPFDAAIAHAGGSPQGLAEVRDQGIKDLDQSFNPGAYQRTNTRYAPHNLYTSRAQLLALHQEKGFTKSDFKGYERKEEKPLTTPVAKTIDFAISSFLYNTHYDYDQKSNSYLRSMGSKPHTDERSSKQINPKVVIAMETTHGYAGIYSVYGVTGSGAVTVFQDGNAIKGTWSKKDRTSHYVFKKADGKPLALNPGQTWITLIKPGQYSSAP